MSEISHKGVVVAIDNQTATVKMQIDSACGSCSLKEVCGHSRKATEIKVELDDKDRFVIGQEVKVILSDRQIAGAAVLGYIIPLILVLVTLISVEIISRDDTLAGGLSLAVLPIYYALIWWRRQSLQKILKIKIK